MFSETFPEGDCGFPNILFFALARNEVNSRVAAQGVVVNVIRCTSSFAYRFLLVTFVVGGADFTCRFAGVGVVSSIVLVIVVEQQLPQCRCSGFDKFKTDRAILE